MQTREHREELGQFLTSPPLAGFMALMFGVLPKTVRALDVLPESLILNKLVPAKHLKWLK